MASGISSWGCCPAPGADPGDFGSAARVSVQCVRGCGRRSRQRRVLRGASVDVPPRIHPPGGPRRRTSRRREAQSPAAFGSSGRVVWGPVGEGGAGRRSGSGFGLALGPGTLLDQGPRQAVPLHAPAFCCSHRRVIYCCCVHALLLLRASARASPALCPWRAMMLRCALLLARAAIPPSLLPCVLCCVCYTPSCSRACSAACMLFCYRVPSPLLQGAPARASPATFVHVSSLRCCPTELCCSRALLFPHSCAADPGCT